MKTRQTSIDCYNQIKKEGLLSKRRLQVLEGMLSESPCTAGELEQYMNRAFNIRGGWKQLSVLREQKVVYERGVRECKVTGRNVIEWDLTDNLPIKLKTQTNTKKKDRTNKALNSLRELYKNKNTSTDVDWKTVADLIKSI